jgi:hypothetical protein
MSSPLIVVPKAGSPLRIQLIDEFGELDRKLRLWQPQANPYIERHAELEAQIQSWAEGKPANKSVVESGLKYQIEISAQGNKRPFSDAARLAAYQACKRIKGLDLFRFFSITQADVKAHLGKAWLDKYLPLLAIGTRTVSVVPLVEAKPASRKAA